MFKRMIDWVRSRISKPDVGDYDYAYTPPRPPPVINLQPVPVTYIAPSIAPEPKKWTREDIEEWKANVRRCDELHRQFWAAKSA
ncbi:hypothetical protein D3C85_465840 [compost metagenome]